jgi:putative NADH-flavin reductase
VEDAAVDHDMVVSAYEPGVQLVDTTDFPVELQSIALARRDVLEDFRKAGFAEFDWTAVSPPALIETGKRTCHYRTGTDQWLVAGKGKSSISAEDLAIAVLDEIENRRFAASVSPSVIDPRLNSLNDALSLPA